jgi:hypothetical protein
VTVTTTRNRQLQPDELGTHPDWCARGHRCGLGEHRAQPVSLDVPGRGVVVLTRVRAADGREHAEVRLRVALAAGDGQARVHLRLLLTELQVLLTRVCHLRR